MLDVLQHEVNEQVIIPVLENDVDADGDILSIESVSQPSNGVAGIRPDGDVIYKPNQNFAGQDEFTYRVCDPSGDCDEATVSVQVLAPPNEPPVAEPDFVTLSEGLNEYPFIPVLANDRDPEVRLVYCLPALVEFANSNTECRVNRWS